jgi:molecular chaperone DnaJ
MARDYYDILGLSKSASDSDIKSAYRKLAMKYHPDRNPGDKKAEENFKEISEAYEVLKDPQKKAAYNQFGHAAFSQGAGGGSTGGFSGFGSGGFSDIFEDMFGMGGDSGRRSASTGSDLRYDLSISLEQAFTGDQVEISLTVPSKCDSCNGSGANKGSKPQQCRQCGGYGKIRAQQGFFTIERTCASCSGAGEIIGDPCRPCNGQGRVNKSKKLSVNVPAGVDNGTRIRLSGEGEAGARGSSAGDLYIFIDIKDHSLFQRDGKDTFIEVPVSFIDAVLGNSIQVPCIDGSKAKMNLSAGTQSGTRLRMKGKGMPGLRGGSRGDQYVQINVETPVGLSRKQEDLFKQINELGVSKISPKTTRFKKLIE